MANIYDIPVHTHHRRRHLPRRPPRQSPPHRQRRLPVRTHQAIRRPRKALYPLQRLRLRHLRLPRQRLRRPGTRLQPRDPSLLHGQLLSRLPPVLQDRRHRPQHPPPLPNPHRRPAQSHRPHPRDLPRAPQRLPQEKHNGATTNPEPGILWNFEKFLIDRNGK